MLCTSSAPAKAILVGEHAVVHGRPALAVPLSQIRAYVDVRATTQRLKVSSAEAVRAPFYWCKGDSNSADPLARTIELTARNFAVNSLQGELIIRSDIPVASGLGSGAAVTAALARGVAALLHRELADERLNSIVFEVEKLHHGTPSGIDNTVVVFERPVYFVKEQSIDFVEFRKPITLMVADTGIPAPTRATVADVRDRLQRQPRQTRALFDQIGAVVEQARECIETGDHTQLGRLMTRNHELLQSLEVSSESLDRLVEAALRGGALGAKLSGGGRGGNMIALVTRELIVSVKEALQNAGAKRVITSTVGGDLAKK